MPVRRKKTASESNDSPTPARIAALLYRKISHGEQDIEPLHAYGDTPRLTFVISMNMEGNGFVANGLLHRSLLHDDTVSDIWIHRQDRGQAPVEWRQLTEHRPGRR